VRLVSGPLRERGVERGHGCGDLRSAAAADRGAWREEKEERKVGGDADEGARLSVAGASRWAAVLERLARWAGRGSRPERRAGSDWAAGKGEGGMGCWAAGGKKRR